MIIKPSSSEQPLFNGQGGGARLPQNLVGAPDIQNTSHIFLYGEKSGSRPFIKDN